MTLLKFREDVKEQIERWLRSEGIADIKDIYLERPPDEKFGDLATSVSFSLAKSLKKSPIDIATEIASSIETNNLIEKVEVASPGYVNFYVDFDKLVIQTFSEVFEKKERFGHTEVGKGLKVQVEYTSVNPNKAIHIGHARNISIGTALVGLLNFTGYKVEVTNFIDDTGSQIADVVLGFLHLSFDPNKTDVKFDQYCGDEVYVKVTRMLEDSERLMSLRSEISKKIDEGGNDVARFAKEVSNRVLKEQLATCWRLGAEYDLLIWESDILRSRLWNFAFEEMKKTGLVRYETDGKFAGCWVAKITEATERVAEEDKVLIRSDGTKTYIAKDIPFAMWKLGKIPSPFKYKIYLTLPGGRKLWSTDVVGEDVSFGSADVSLNVIGSEQTTLQQLIRLFLSSLYGSEVGERYIHHNYEAVSLSRETVEKYLGVLIDRDFLHMSGRRGIYFNVDPMLDLLKTMAITESTKRNPELSDVEAAEIGDKVAVASLKYPLLSLDRDKIVIFDVDKALNITEESGAYILYSYARANRILEKSNLQTNIEDLDVDLICSEEECKLIELIAEFPAIVSEAAKNINIKIVARFMYQLALQFNRFYETCPVLSVEGKDLMKNRLLFIKAYTQTMENLGSILRLPLLERM